MLRTSIFEKRWLDLVFDGKNKAYGAYHLRLESPRTTLLAMYYGILFISGISGGGFLLSSFGPAPTPAVVTDTGTILKLKRMPGKSPGIEKPKTQIPEKRQSVRKTDWRIDPVVSKPITDITETIENPGPTPIQSGSATGTPVDNGSQNGTDGTLGTATGTIATPSNTPVVESALDKRPMFPGGMEKFYQRIANEFEKPELYENRDLRIIMSFVIEPDGSMTGIKVISKADVALEREAIRVLKSINKKWEPGMKDGKSVRTLFTLPILLRPQ